MKTRKSLSVQPSYQSEEEYIEKNKHVCKSVHPQLTFRQIRNKLSSEWSVLNNKPKRYNHSIKSLIILSIDYKLNQMTLLSKQSIFTYSQINLNLYYFDYISKTVQKKQSKKQLKQKLQKHNNKNKNKNINKHKKPFKNPNQQLKKTRISPSQKQGPTILISDSESFKISLTSQEDKKSILKDSPIVISTNSLQIKEVNQRPQKNKRNSKPKKEESKQHFIDHQKVQKKIKKPNLQLPIKKLKLRRLNKLKKLKSSNNQGIASDFQPVLALDFINSAKKYDHVSLISISKSNVDQGQVGLNEIKNIVSHTYGIINHEQNNSEILNFQLFFEVEFQPIDDRHVIRIYFTIQLSKLPFIAKTQLWNIFKNTKIYLLKMMNIIYNEQYIYINSYIILHNFNYNFIMEAYIGFKIMPYYNQIHSQDLFAKYSQTTQDWSAIYIQITPQHALNYIYTKYERFQEVCLMKFKFNDQIKFIKLDNENFSKYNLPSKDKAQISRAILQSSYGISIEQNQPLMDTLGKLNIGLIMEDSEKQYEYIVPHNLMQDGKCYQSIIPIRFQRHESKIFRTIKLIINNESKDLDCQYQDRIHDIPLDFDNL